MTGSKDELKVEDIVLDDLDKKILHWYLIDARLSYRELAHKLGVSTTTVQSRTAKLEKAGIIRGYSAMFDHDKIGFQLTAIRGERRQRQAARAGEGGRQDASGASSIRCYRTHRCDGYREIQEPRRPEQVH